MAELHVQRKRNSNWWIWLLLAIIIIGAAVFIYLYYYDKNAATNSPGVSDTTLSDTVNRNASYNLSDSTTMNGGFWEQIDFNATDTTYDEVRSKKVTEKADRAYGIYRIENDLLFDSGKTFLSTAGREVLNDVGASLNKRFRDGNVKIYSHMDTSDAELYQVADQRADVVRQYLANKSKLDARQISIYPIGKFSALAYDRSGLGNQKDKSIQIVAKR